MRNDWVSYIKANAGRFGLDPQAVLAIASHEGLSGNVGDGGHAFGPFQLNDAGGVITNRPGNHRAFAESKQGIDWAMERMAAAGARGKTGMEAIKAIATNFERPANVQGEINDAASNYGHVGAGVRAGKVGGPVQASGPMQATSPFSGFNGEDPRKALLAMMLSQPDKPFNSHDSSSGMGDILSTLVQLRALSQQQAPGGPQTASPARGLSSASTPATRVVPSAGRLTAVRSGYETRPGIEINSAIANSVYGITNHFGVKVNSGYRDPAHNQSVGGAPNSDHLSGNAVDFTGTPQQMKALYSWAQGRFPYVEPWDQAHGDHVHISFAR